MERLMLMAAVKAVIFVGVIFGEACTETWVDSQKHKTDCNKILRWESIFVPCRCGTIPKVGPSGLSLIV